MKMHGIWSLICLLLLVGCGTSGQFVVKSEPAGAEIFIDGRPFGRTPATLQVPFVENKQMVTEKKIISLKMSGYKEMKDVLTYQGNTSKTLDFKLEPVSGS